MAAIFGGKKRLESGTNELMLFTSKSKKALFYIPLDVRGKSPSPRWGQSFITLAGNNGRAAFLSGGRNMTSVVSDAYTLSYTTSRKSGSNLMHFLWEKVNLDVPRFNHYTSLVSNYQKDIDTILIIGGLVKSNDLLQTFSLSSKKDKRHHTKDLNSYSIIYLGNDFSDQIGQLFIITQNFSLFQTCYSPHLTTGFLIKIYSTILFTVELYLAMRNCPFNVFHLTKYLVDCPL